MEAKIITPISRGQITIPKKFRDKLGINEKTPLSISLDEKEGRIYLKPLESKSKGKSGPQIIKARLSRAEYLKVLRRMKGPVWAEGDVREWKKMRTQEKKRLNALDELTF